MDPTPMNTCDIKPRMQASEIPFGRVLPALALSILLSLIGGRGVGDDLVEGYELRSEVTLGARLHAVDAPYDDNQITGFFDQYRYVDDKRNTLSYFLDFPDLFHSVDLGLVRADGTYLMRAERVSRNEINENTLLDFDWRGLVVDAEIRRYRSDSLRLFPKGTEDGWSPLPGESPAGFAFGSTYAPDVQVADLFAADHRIYAERLKVGGEISIRPDGFGFDSDFLNRASFRAGHETRKGYRQDRFLLDGRENTAALESFRGNRRKLDQTLTEAGTTLVLSPWGEFVGQLSLDYQRFQEKAPIVTLADISTGAVGITPPSASPETMGREFFFVPDTNRFTGSLQLTRRQGRATLNAGASASHLEQSGRRSNLQSLAGLADNAVTTVSTHADLSIPLGALDLTGFLKYNYRYNRLDQHVFSQLDPIGQQESPYIAKRRELRGSLEIGAAPSRGSRLGLGYRLVRVDRDLVFPALDPALPTTGIQPRVSLIGEKNLRHTAFVKARGRIFRSLRASGELSYAWAPQVAYPTDLSEAVSFRARTHYTLRFPPLPFPISLSAAGRIVDGENSEFDLPCPDTCDVRTRKFERLEWGYNLSATIVPRESLVFYGTFSQSGDQQDFDYMRTDLPRYFDGLGIPSLRASFYVDSVPHYESDLKSLTVGGQTSHFRGVDLGLSATLTWVDLWAKGAPDVGSNVGSLINDENRIQNRIFSLDGNIDYRATPRLAFGFGYRYQEFVDTVDLGPLDLDSSAHRITLRVTIDFAETAKSSSE